ncbi:DUF2026 family protein [Burkholderia multivorans]|uniref:DUF2026 family protein n=1 Tax=Burkholderiaceae TaxID=119060 RepID=UPI000582FE16|nr:DUF2026 family protein [Burkholderia multivorans]KHS13958.1 hypothetical protein BMD20_12505 [Burkholderia multivorans]MDR9229598.1 hypothetical protein [Burkholderia multivorans]HDR9473279.1 DUF2026 family protein [Burkholderia multivorans]
MPRSTRLVIPLRDYQRIFQVAHGIIREVGRDVSRSCLFFNMVGAHLIGRNYKTAARPVIGSAFYKLETTDKVLAVADEALDFQHSTHDGFHCWVEADDWILDFTAPLFPEMALHSGHVASCGRKMFQRHRKDMAGTFEELVSPGDFFLEPNPELTRELLSDNLRRNDVKDLLAIAALWFQRPPRKIESTMTITDDLGNVKALRLDAPLITGVW